MNSRTGVLCRLLGPWAFFGSLRPADGIGADVTIGGIVPWLRLERVVHGQYLQLSKQVSMVFHQRIGQQVAAAPGRAPAARRVVAPPRWPSVR